jgi:hypothetical protein
MLATGVYLFALLLIYDYMKIDWLLIEALKESLENFVHKKRHNFITKKIIFLRTNHPKKLFFILSAWDPFVITIYRRNGYNKWNNFSDFKTFGVFVLSLFLSNLVVAIFESGFKTVFF